MMWRFLMWVSRKLMWVSRKSNGPSTKSLHAATAKQGIGVLWWLVRLFDELLVPEWRHIDRFVILVP
ncbi:hypothetical protein [Marinomonas shanghaiensis]|uniref:hypothetical protein n=1 Tax=Marinomonas shanghaiensis TaxID=2202418 RepID=UPI000DB90E39|nr:hypothetical protein [Marinomonas shanghaiensis]